MRSRSNLWSLCNQDHAKRSAQRNFEKLQDPKLGLCHLGLWNLAYPIFHENVYYGALITGQRKLKDSARTKESEECFTRRVQQLKSEGLVDVVTKGEMTARFAEVEYINEFPANSIKALAAVENSLIGIISDLLRRINRITMLRHEIHQPNTAARGILCESRDILADVLSNQQLSIKEVSQQLVNAQQNIKYAVSNSILFSTIVENICSTLSADTGALIVSRCNVLALLQEAQKIFESPAGDKDVIFEPIVKNDLDMPNIEADKALLMRAFMNVYHNAVKYSYFGQSEDKPRRIQTSCEGLEKYVKITIANFGLGILPDEMDKIFKEGYRGKLSSDRHRTGSGLGLSQVKRIIDEQHNGKTEIESRPLGQSIEGPYLTKVFLYIPYVQEEVEVT